MRRPGVWCAGLLVLAGATIAQEGFRPLRGPYMGQEAGDVPRLFLPGKIASGHDEGSCAFFPGARAFLWQVRRGDRDLLLLLEDRDGRWQPPEEQEPLGPGARVGEFALSPDGSTLYFTSDHPAGGAGGRNLWRVRWEAGRWGRPEPLGGVNSDGDEAHPSVSRDGTLYFHRRDPSDPSRDGVYSASPSSGGFGAARRLGESVNGPSPACDPAVSPDGSRLLFCSRRPGGLGQGDLYVSTRRDDGAWGEARNLGAGVNSPADESHPSVTLDGRYLFFTSDRKATVELPPGVPPARSMPGGGSRDLYWVKADALYGTRN
jgi:hypothetical protein